MSWRMRAADAWSVIPDRCFEIVATLTVIKPPQIAVGVPTI
jgi:hypothetical protein